jgi:hypothetical protein
MPMDFDVEFLSSMARVWIAPQRLLRASSTSARGLDPETANQLLQARGLLLKV